MFDCENLHVTVEKVDKRRVVQILIRVDEISSEED